MRGTLPVEINSPTSVLTKALEKTFFQDNTNVLGLDTGDGENVESPEHCASVVTGVNHVKDASLRTEEQNVSSDTGKSNSPYTPLRGERFISPTGHANDSSFPTQDALDMLAYAAESELAQNSVRRAFIKHINNVKESSEPDDTQICKKVTGRFGTISHGSNIVENDDVEQTRNAIVSALSCCVCCRGISVLLLYAKCVFYKQFSTKRPSFRRV